MMLRFPILLALKAAGIWADYLPDDVTIDSNATLRGEEINGTEPANPTIATGTVYLDGWKISTTVFPDRKPTSCEFILQSGSGFEHAQCCQSNRDASIAYFGPTIVEDLPAFSPHPTCNGAITYFASRTATDTAVPTLRNWNTTRYEPFIIEGQAVDYPMVGPFTKFNCEITPDDCATLWVKYLDGVREFGELAEKGHVDVKRFNGIFNRPWWCTLRTAEPSFAKYTTFPSCTANAWAVNVYYSGVSRVGGLCGSQGSFPQVTAGARIPSAHYDMIPMGGRVYNLTVFKEQVTSIFKANTLMNITETWINTLPVLTSYIQREMFANRVYAHFGDLMVGRWTGSVAFRWARNKVRDFEATGFNCTSIVLTENNLNEDFTWYTGYNCSAAPAPYVNGVPGFIGQFVAEPQYKWEKLNDIIIEMKTKEMSTVRLYYSNLSDQLGHLQSIGKYTMSSGIFPPVTATFNGEDLAFPYNWQEYFANRGDFRKIHEGAYYPWLAFPTQLRSVHPMLAGCAFPDYVQDPPGTFPAQPITGMLPEPTDPFALPTSKGPAATFKPILSPYPGSPIPVPTSEPTGITRPAQEQLGPDSSEEQPNFNPNQLDQLPQDQSFAGSPNDNSPAEGQRATPTLRGIVFAESGDDGKGGGKVTAVFNEAQTAFNINGVVVSKSGTITLAGGRVLAVDESGNLVVAGQTISPSDLPVAQPTGRPRGSYGTWGSDLGSNDGVLINNGNQGRVSGETGIDIPSSEDGTNGGGGSTEGIGTSPKDGTKKKSDATPSASQLCWASFVGISLALVMSL